MTTISFFARGDSNTANNAALNANNTNQTPTTEITFSSGVDGDLWLEPNGGNPDPDTTVIVNGVEMTFTLNFFGTLPNTNKLSNVNGVDLRGEPVIVITTEDGQRLFFLPSAPGEVTMDAFPNGAHDLDAFTSTTSIPVCFVSGSGILTPSGERAVDELRIGDHVTTYQGKARPIRWITRRHLSFADLLAAPHFRPVCLPKGMFGRLGPHRDLWLSPQHRFLFRGWEAELLFRNDEVLVPAASCRGLSQAPNPDVAGGVTYYHLFLDRHEILLANGLPCESLYPGESALASLTDDARRDLALHFQEYGDNWQGYGSTARLCLTRREGRMLLQYSGLLFDETAPARTALCAA